MSNWILFPPVAFLLIFALSIFLSYLLSRLSYKPRLKEPDGGRKAYACGEDISEHRVQVDYGQFFPFAFFFTILHVLALMVATVPAETSKSFFVAAIYLLGAVTGLIILFRR